MPPKRRSTAVPPPSKDKTPRQSALAKEHSISAATESDIKEAFLLFANASKKEIPTASLRRALTALGVPPASAEELDDLTEAADPEESDLIPYSHFVAVAALKLNSRSEESEAREVEDAFQLFIAQGGGRQGKITVETLKRVARVLKEDVSDELLRDMMLEADGGAGVGQGVGIGEFEGLMRRAGVFSLLNGNITTSLTNSMSDINTCDGNVTVYDDSSKILLNGLGACDEILHNYWNGDDAIEIGQNGPVSWRNATTSVGISDAVLSNKSDTVLSNKTFTHTSNDLFTKPPWMCRNRTLLRAIEDLANNVTISMLSSVNLTKPNMTTVNVTTFPVENVYQYESRNLTTSYTVAIMLTLICICIGLFALHYNGEAHSTTFSVIIATTKNKDLDDVSRGGSLRVPPTGVSETKLRFGVLVGESGKGSGEWDELVKHGEEGKIRGQQIRFGAVERVVGLKRGRVYT